MSVLVKTKNRKVKRIQRREFVTERTETTTFEVRTLARTKAEAEKIVQKVFDRMRAPKAVRVKVGKRSRLLKDGEDYFVDFTMTSNGDCTTDVADEHDRFLT